MHAVLVSVAIEDEQKAVEQLQNVVVPMVKGLPGAVHGYWLQPGGGQGYSTVVFETEEQAKAAAEGVRVRAPEGVTVQQVSMAPVVAHF
ncbi:MAG: hypothetical protein ABR613_13265 [Actinomycetota bacterium]